MSAFRHLPDSPCPPFPNSVTRVKEPVTAAGLLDTGVTTYDAKRKVCSGLSSPSYNNVLTSHRLD